MYFLGGGGGINKNAFKVHMKMLQEIYAQKIIVYLYLIQTNVEMTVF